MLLIFIFIADYINPLSIGNRVTKGDRKYNFFKLNIQIFVNFLTPEFKIPVESVRYFKKTEGVKCPRVLFAQPFYSKGEGAKKKKHFKSGVTCPEWPILAGHRSYVSLLTRFCVSAKAARITDKTDNGKTSNLGGEKKRRNDGRKIEGIRVVER